MFAGELLAILTEAKTYANILKVEHERMVIFDEAQHELKTMVGIASEVAQENAARDRDIVQVTLGIVDASLSVDSLESR